MKLGLGSSTIRSLGRQTKFFAESGKDNLKVNEKVGLINLVYRSSELRYLQLKAQKVNFQESSNCGLPILIGPETIRNATIIISVKTRYLDC